MTVNYWLKLLLPVSRAQWDRIDKLIIITKNILGRTGVEKNDFGSVENKAALLSYI